MFLLNGKHLPEGTSFYDANGNQYGSGWLNQATEEQKLAIGITWVADPAPVDTRFYWDHNLPKDLDDLKKQFIGQVKDTAGKLLSQTDWQVIRKAERYIDIEPGVIEKRAHVINEANRLEAAINNSSSVEVLIDVLNNQKWEM